MASPKTSSCGVSDSNTKNARGGLRFDPAVPLWSSHLTLKGIFMTIFLLIVIAILIGLLIQQYRYRQRLIKGSIEVLGASQREAAKWQAMYNVRTKDYKALEEGQEELIDNYENDFLDLRNEIARLKSAGEYDRDMREEAEKQLASLQSVVDSHSEHCETIIKDIVDGLLGDILPKGE